MPLHFLFSGKPPGTWAFRECVEFLASTSRIDDERGEYFSPQNFDFSRALKISYAPDTSNQTFMFVREESYTFVICRGDECASDS